MMILSPALQPRWNAVLLDIFQYFIALCKTHNLTYYCAGGTAIGAIRHQGFIPWDDDIDVFMPRPDYDRLMDIYARQDMGRYELCTPYNTDNYFMHFSKLCRRDTTIMERVDTPCVYGMFIDIFPLDGTADDKDEALRLKRRFEKIQNRMEAISTHYRFTDYLALLKQPHEWGRFVRKTFGFVARGAYRRHLLRKMDAICRLYPFEKATNVVTYSGVYHGKEVYPKAWIAGTKRFMFEGLEVDLPLRYDEYLRHFFGDYMQLPPVEQRMSHHEKVYFNMDERVSLATIRQTIRK